LLQCTKIVGWLSKGGQIILVAIRPNGDDVIDVHKIYQIAIKKSTWANNVPNRYKIFLKFPFKGLPKSTKAGVWFENKALAQFPDKTSS
jgi:hypothetical protein